MSEALARFIIGGLVVSAFAIIGGLFKPVSFAGLFGALGAAMGSIGLMAFAGIGWWPIPRYPAPLALSDATVGWLPVSFSIWTIRQQRRRLL